jgi:hypothetical protein
MLSRGRLALALLTWVGIGAGCRNLGEARIRLRLLIGSGLSRSPIIRDGCRFFFFLGLAWWTRPQYARVCFLVGSVLGRPQLLRVPAQNVLGHDVRQNAVVTVRALLQRRVDVHLFQLVTTSKVTPSPIAEGNMFFFYHPAVSAVNA